MNNIQDENMLEFLMNSEFVESYKPEEYKNFLSKFKVFYRILHGRLSSDIIDLKFKNKNFEEMVKSLRSENESLIKKNGDLELSVKTLKSPRKISIKERFWGKTNQIL